MYSKQFLLFFNLADSLDTAETGDKTDGMLLVSILLTYFSSNDFYFCCLHCY